MPKAALAPAPAIAPQIAGAKGLTGPGVKVSRGRDDIHKVYDLYEQEAIHASIKESARLERRLKRANSAVPSLDVLRGPSGQVLSPIPPSEVSNFVQHRGPYGDRIIPLAERESRTRQASPADTAAATAASRAPEGTDSDHCIAQMLQKLDLEEHAAQIKAKDNAARQQGELHATAHHVQQQRDRERELALKRDAMHRFTHGYSTPPPTAPPASSAGSARTSHRVAYPPGHRLHHATASPGSSASGMSDRTVRLASGARARHPGYVDVWGNPIDCDRTLPPTPATQDQDGEHRAASPATTVRQPLSRYSDRSYHARV